MIVLSRRMDEAIRIGDNIIVSVVSIIGDRVRLGITCPPELPVHRQEIFEAIRRGDKPVERKSNSEFRPPNDFMAGPADAVESTSTGPESANVRLSAEHWGGLDRVRDVLEKNSGRRPGRRETAEAALQAVAEIEVNVGDCMSLAEFKLLIKQALSAYAPRVR